jgi:predicted DNA-binding transcriptional regulator AlpA
MNAANTETSILAIGETAATIRISQRQIHTLMQNGSGPPVIRLGRRKIVRREALRQWLVEREGRHHDPAQAVGIVEWPPIRATAGEP